MNTEEKKQLAFALYAKSSVKYTRKDIAKQVGTTEKTLRGWIENGEWDLQRDALQITRPQLLQEAYAQLKAINQQIAENHRNIPTKELSDAKAIIRKEIEAFSTQPIHRYIEVFEEFIEWLAKNEPAQNPIFGPLAQLFISDVSKRK
ncbi:MAG TPA: phage terminase small subunit-related protein [Crocinitomicaceae bacterium]|nr:phage terminase small subunit-related protein [Crocinitomicaceae bacterium]